MRRPRKFSELADWAPSSHWPVTGEKLFNAKSLMTAGVADLRTAGTSHIMVLADAYKQAADLLVEQALEGGSINFLIYPILFCYRHFVELSLKSLLGWYHAKPQNIWTEHNLESLWCALVPALDSAEIANDATRLTAQTQITEFQEFDPRSDAARYHVNTKGDAMVMVYECMDLRLLEKGMDGLAAYFTYLIEASSPP